MRFTNFAFMLVLVSTVAGLLSGCDNQRVTARVSATKPLELQADGLLIKFKPEYSANTSAAKKTRADILKPLNLKETGALGALAKSWVRVVSTTPVDNYLDLAAQVTKLPEIDSVEPNHVMTMQAFTPDDPEFVQQYALHNTRNPKLNSDIDAPTAWDIKSDAKTVVAIIDTGIDYAHPDLKKNIWTNKNEIPNNKVDDDANGYADDVYGWNFVDNNAEVMDDNNHGTFTAGIIGAKGNNGIGIAGVNWSARLLPLKVLDRSGTGSVANLILAIQYAIEKGANISNIGAGVAAESQALNEAITRATQLGHIVVAAAGNKTSNNDQTKFYPASINTTNVISVAASNQDGELANFSNYGVNSVDLVAPGLGIFSTIISTKKMETYETGYGVASGTSFAAAYVSGVLSLAMELNPKVSPADLKNLLLLSSSASGALTDKVASGAILNAEKLLAAVQAAPPSAANPGTDGSGSNAIEISTAVSEIVIGNSIELTVRGGVQPFTWTMDKLGIGAIDSTTNTFTATQKGQVSITVTDATGAVSPPVTFTVVELSLLPKTVDKLLVGQSLAFAVQGGTPPYTWNVGGDAGVVALNLDNADSAQASVTGLKPGRFTITVSDNSGVSTLTAQSQDIIIEPSPLTIDIPANTNVAVGTAIRLVATGGDGQYTWASSDSTVAAIDVNTGVVTALAPSTVTITAADGLGNTDSIALTSTIAPLNAAIPSVDVLWVGNAGTTKIDVSGGVAPYTWSSDNTAVATVDANGMVTAKSAGVANIRVTDSTGNSYSVINDIVTIVVKEVLISASATIILVGDTLKLSAVGQGTLTWSVDKPALATISSSGQVNALAAGNVVVTVVDQNNNSAMLSVVINPLAPLSISSTTSTLSVTRDARSTATLTGSGGKAPYTWAIASGANVMSVNTNGIVTALAAGNATVQMTDSLGQSMTHDFVVVNVNLSANTNEITAGNTLSLIASGAGALTYAVDRADLASVSSNGVLTASKAGTVQVTVTDQNNISASVNVTIYAAVSIATPSATTIWTNSTPSTVTLTANGGKPTITWTSSNAAVATVDSSGIVSAVAVGTVTITARDALGSQASQSITVNTVGHAGH